MLLIDIRNLAQEYHRLQQTRGTRQRKKTIGDAFRLAQWCGDASYQLIKEGKRRFSGKENILDEFRKRTLHVDDFYQFSNGSSFLSLIRLDSGAYMVPQMRFYKQAYANAGRLDYRLGSSILSDGTPYWASVYYKRLTNERLSKAKYQKKRAL